MSVKVVINDHVVYIYVRSLMKVSARISWWFSGTGGGAYIVFSVKLTIQLRYKLQQCGDK